MIFNKWMNFGVSALGAVAAFASTIDWNTLVSSKTASGIATAALLFRTLTAAIAPAGASVTGSSAIVTK